VEGAGVAGAGAEFAAKSKTARRFVTLGPRRGCPAVRGGQRGGGRPPGGSQGAPPPRGRGPGRAATPPPKRVWTRGNLRLTTP
jgi:hypothetical protein